MYRGTTPTLRFTLPFPCEEIDVCSIAFSQKLTPYADESELIFEKKLSDCSVSEKNLTLTLSEEDTLKLRSDTEVEIQLRVACGEARLASPIFKKPAERILKDGPLI